MTPAEREHFQDLCRRSMAALDTGQLALARVLCIEALQLVTAADARTGPEETV